VTLTPDGTQLYVTNGNLNSIAVVALTGTDKNDQVVGSHSHRLVPELRELQPQWPMVYVVNGKSPTGPNPIGAMSMARRSTQVAEDTNEYNPQLTKAGLQKLPDHHYDPHLDHYPYHTAPGVDGAGSCEQTTSSSTESASDAAVMAAVRQGIQHVIFIIKEKPDLRPGSGRPGPPATAIQFGSMGEARSRRICITWRKPSSRSITSWPLPKSAMTAGCGAPGSRPRRSGTPIPGGLRGTRPQLG